MRLEPVAYMTWAKTNLERGDIHNLGSSGIRELLDLDDLGVSTSGLTIAGRNEDGLPALRAAIAARYRVPGDQVLVAEGASLANFLVLAAWLRPGDPVLLEEPYYEPLGSVLRALGARVRYVAVDGPQGHRAILSALRGGRIGRWRAAVVTNPHNPTGQVIGEDLLAELASACEEQGALLVVDEAYREILFEEPPGCAVHCGPCVASTASLTKVYGLSHLRVGWGIGPASLIARAIRIHDNLGVVHPFLTEAIGASVMADSSRLALWRERIRTRVEANRKALAGVLSVSSYLEGGLPPQGILAFLHWKGTDRFPDAEVLCDQARKRARIVLVPGRFFQRPEWLRIAVGGLEPKVAAACAALAAFLGEG